MTKDELRVAAPDLARFVDELRTAGVDVTLKHVALEGGVVIGKVPPLPANCAELDWSERSLFEDWAAMTKGKRK